MPAGLSRISLSTAKLASKLLKAGVSVSSNRSPASVGATLRVVRVSSNNAIRYVFLTPPQPDMTEAAFNFDRDPARMRASADFADATDADLQTSRTHGRTMILYHGMADPAISAFDTVRYYEALQRANGGADATVAFARLFLIPGMAHCSGGGGLDSFDRSPRSQPGSSMGTRRTA